MLWAGFAPTLGLQFMVAFLPTFLLLIFGFFFTLKAEAFAQHKLQKWYFWFQMFFVVLTTAIGQDFVGFLSDIAKDPFGIFGLLADKLPSATHFYMNFLTLQWFTHAMVLTRYIVLAKFKAFSAIYDEAEAKKLAEPEDQDYYGIGSRSARWSINLTISIVYGTLSPPVMILGLMTFALNRILYGYIIPFAETRKADLGGVFWVTMLQHTFTSNVLYCILMTGVLTRRAATWGPVAIAASSIVYVLWSMRRFNSKFSWESLPFEESASDSAAKKVIRPIDGQYVQPEMEG